MRLIVLILWLSWSPFALSGPIYEMFHDGIFDVKWGEDLEGVKNTHPGGVVISNAGLYAYEIKDGRTILGVKRKSDNYIQFLFNSEEKLNYVYIQFTPDNTQESAALFTKLDELFGSDWKQPNVLNPTISWPKDGNILIFFRTEISFSGKIENVLMIKAEIEINTSKEQLGF